MPSHHGSLRDDAIAIWKAGVDSVQAEALVRSFVRREGDWLHIGDRSFSTDALGRIAVVGAGKAGAGMAAGFEKAIGRDLHDRLSGWVNVPADCVRRLSAIRLHPARPPGVNEPTQEGVRGAEQVLRIVSSLEPDDLCVVLISGGGSALLPLPVEGVSLEDKRAISSRLSRAGATIEELNCVRKQLSRIKGGRLAAACSARQMVSLIISDVVGDPLDIIASGPTVPDSSTAEDALAVLRRYSGTFDVPASVQQFLNGQSDPSGEIDTNLDSQRSCQVSNHVIGNIESALKAAADKARRLGYEVLSLGGANRGVAREVGVDLAERCLAVCRSETRPVCVLSGGEPVVNVVPTDQPRRGGRNQELALAAARTLWSEEMSHIALLSGGTDGEDGPTDAAGALVDAAVIQTARSLGLDPDEFLAINNSYPFFEQTNGLLKTGPTHTNVMDLRVAVIRPD